MNIDPHTIAEQLAQINPDDLTTCPPLPGVINGGTQPAAVLIPLLLDQSVWKILFIKRTMHQKDRHSGQIAFPGGSFDKKDRSLEGTALRETQEEIGLNPEFIHILGRSCSMFTVTGYEVTPYVGILTWPTQLVLSEEEVEKIILIPIEWLVKPGNHRIELWRSRSVPDTELPVIFFDQYEGEVLWGATAQILMDFLDLVGLSVS
jgi:8-oxo-dGTP pyrophosphatase MutT (NUDIX family)